MFARNLFAVVLILSSGCASSVERAAPNILFILVDDLGRQDLATYGSRFYETPNIDALAADGMRFDNAYTAHPRCVPARVGIMSGRYPASYGVPGFEDRSQGKHALPLSTVTFAEALRDSGYRTGYIGKWHLGKEGGGPEAQGFDVSIMAGHSGAPPGYFWPYQLKKNGKADKKGFVPYEGGTEGEYLTDRLTDEAIAFIEREKQGPFLLVLAHYAVHTPIEAPEELVSKYKKKVRKQNLSRKWSDDIVADSTGEVKTEQNHPVYAGMVASVDDNVGRLLNKLDEAGISDNTVVVLTSDHGGLSSRAHDGTRELATSNAPYRHGKGWLYDGGIRVPMIVRWPSVVEAGSVSAVQTTGTDHYATFLEMAGIDAAQSSQLDSVSYRDVLNGRTKNRTPMFWHSSLGRPTQTGDTRSSAIIDGDWKLIQWYSLETEDIERVELFNIADDPGERRDLSSQHTAQRERLEQALTAWKKSVNARLGAFKNGA